MKLHQIGPNQTQIDLADGTAIFFSYKTPVAAHIPGQGYVRTAWKHSVTTSRHINKWVNGSAQEMPQSFFDNLAKAA